MFCKQLLALFLWCHCYQIVLNPIVQLIAFGLSNSHSFASLNHHYVSGSPITVAANKVTLTPGQEIVLRCNIAEHPDARFTWYKQRLYPITAEQPEVRRDPQEELSSNDQRYTISNNILIIKSGTSADVGDYFCRVQESYADLSTQEQMISVRPKPYIYDFVLPASTPRSAVVEEGTSLQISCNVADEFFPADQMRIVWLMSRYDENDMNLVQSGEEGIELRPTNSTSSDLIIKNVTKDHRRTYKCQVDNGVTENSKTILIRVKNHLTVIWPAVGILLELVILIGVICVVENRKVEPDRGANDRRTIHQM